MLMTVRVASARCRSVVLGGAWAVRSVKLLSMSPGQRRDRSKVKVTFSGFAPVCRMGCRARVSHSARTQSGRCCISDLSSWPCSWGGPPSRTCRTSLSSGNVPTGGAGMSRIGCTPCAHKGLPAITCAMRTPAWTCVSEIPRPGQQRAGMVCNAPAHADGCALFALFVDFSFPRV